MTKPLSPAQPKSNKNVVDSIDCPVCSARAGENCLGYAYVTAHIARIEASHE